MPFTFAHPSIVLPLATRIKRLSLTTLIIGSMVPDFGFFIFLNDESKHGHTWLGMFYFDLPIAMALAFFYHNILRFQLVKSLPQFFATRINFYNDFNWNRYFNKNIVAVIISCLIGIASHLLWDTFTHYDVANFKRFPWMLYPIRLSDTYVIGLFVLLWYFSSIVGVLAMFIFIYKLPKKEIANKNAFKFWLLVTFISIAAFGLRLLILPPFKNPPEVFIVVLGVFLWGLIMASIIFRFWVGRISDALKQQ